MIDFKTAPYGCGVWPAFWTVGPNWPIGGKFRASISPSKCDLMPSTLTGEIDIFEGVHYGPTNQMTLHTAPGCATDTNSTVPGDFRIQPISAGLGSSNCGPSPSNGGCYFVDNNPTSYGSRLHDAGGAVVAMEWSVRGIRICAFIPSTILLIPTTLLLGNFPRSHVPLDLKLQKPVPALWSPSYLKAAWASTTCLMSKYFKQHSIIIDITLCGDWAGSTYASAGCPGTCVQHVMTASNFDSEHEPISELPLISHHVRS